jgi:Recombination endonuclease VII
MDSLILPKRSDPNYQKIWRKIRGKKYSYPDYKKKWIETHKEETKAYQKDYRKQNKSKNKTYQKKYKSKSISDYYGRRWKYAGIKNFSYQQYLDLIEHQNNQCDICKNPLDPPFVDHNHTTGNVRGLLCLGCNTSLGHFHDSPEILNNAIKYLEKNNDPR